MCLCNHNLLLYVQFPFPELKSPQMKNLPTAHAQSTSTKHVHPSVPLQIIMSLSCSLTLRMGGYIIDIAPIQGAQHITPLMEPSMIWTPIVLCVCDSFTSTQVAILLLIPRDTSPRLHIDHKALLHIQEELYVSTISSVEMCLQNILGQFIFPGIWRIWTDTGCSL